MGNTNATDILLVSSVSYDASTHALYSHYPSPIILLLLTLARELSHVINTHTHILARNTGHTLAERCCGNVHRQSLSLCICITYNSIYIRHIFLRSIFKLIKKKQKKRKVDGQDRPGARLNGFALTHSRLVLLRIKGKGMRFVTGREEVTSVLLFILDSEFVPRLSRFPYVRSRYLGARDITTVTVRDPRRHNSSHIHTHTYDTHHHLYSTPDRCWWNRNARQKLAIVCFLLFFLLTI